MSAIASPAQHLPLAADGREQVGGDLQATAVVELIDLYLGGKQLHWSVVGLLFWPWCKLTDTVAERAVAIGARRTAGRRGHREHTEVLAF